MSLKIYDNWQRFLYSLPSHSQHMKWKWLSSLICVFVVNKRANYYHKTESKFFMSSSTRIIAMLLISDARCLSAMTLAQPYQDSLAWFEVVIGLPSAFWAMMYLLAIDASTCITATTCWLALACLQIGVGSTPADSIGRELSRTSYNCGSDHILNVSPPSISAVEF